MSNPDPFDELAPPGPLETFAFYGCMFLMLLIVVGVISFTTGLLWADLIRPSLELVATWIMAVWP